MSSATDEFRAARDFLLAHRTDYVTAYAKFRWPRPERFNFAIDWFDTVLAAERPNHTALRIIEADGTDESYSFGALSERSDQVAGWLRGEGVRRGMQILVVLGNQVELWEITLAAMKLGAVIIPATTLLSKDDLRDRIDRGHVDAVVARSDITEHFRHVHGGYLRIAVGDPVVGWLRYADSFDSLEPFEPDEHTMADEPLLLYFTSGTTALPKLVEHTHVSYPIGHLSTMYWIGLQPGDVHMNVSSPGWAKHAWSCVFAPWIAGATICLFNYERFDARALLDVVRDTKVTTFCAPPTVWRMLVQQDLASWQMSVRELVSAGEPLNPEVIEQVRQAWGLTIRDGFGQTETTLQIGNSPGQPTRLGSMGRPMPGFRIALVDPRSEAIADEGEICVECEPERPVGLMVGYQGDHERNADAFAGHRYHTGDVATRDPRRVHHLRGPHRRRVQGQRLPDQSVRAGERADRAPGRGRGGGRTGTGRTAAGRPQGLRRARQRIRTEPGARLGHPAPLSRETRVRTSGFAACSSRNCRRPSAARSGGSNCGRRKPSGPASGRRASTARRISRTDRRRPLDFRSTR